MKKVRYTIKQLAIGSDNIFRSYKKEHFKPEEYVSTWHGEIEVEDGATDIAVLDMLFEEFNTRRPFNFAGHSMSVSDLVVIHTADESRTYYCDGIGWKKIDIE